MHIFFAIQKLSGFFHWNYTDWSVHRSDNEAVKRIERLRFGEFAKDTPQGYIKLGELNHILLQAYIKGGKSYVPFFKEHFTDLFNSNGTED
jgi:hypothetical protein